TTSSTFLQSLGSGGGPFGSGAEQVHPAGQTPPPPLGSVTTQGAGGTVPPPPDWSEGPTVARKFPGETSRWLIRSASVIASSAASCAMLKSGRPRFPSTAAARPKSTTPWS